MPHAHVAVPTPAAARYLDRLCRHFARRVATQWDDAHGRIALPAARVVLVADPSRLRVEIEAATGADLAEAETTITRQLVLFAFHERLTVDWRSGPRDGRE